MLPGASVSVDIDPPFKGYKMLRHVLVSVIFVSMVTVMARKARCAVNRDGENHDASEMVTVSVIEQMIGSKKLTLRYQIKNASDRDIWICESMHAGALAHFEAYLCEDDETLLVQRRLDMPMEVSCEQPMGRYFRLPSGETRSELMSLSLPVRHRRILSGGGLRRPLEYATRLALEVGYYVGDLPALTLSVLDEAEAAARADSGSCPPSTANILKYTGGSRFFIMRSEWAVDRDSEVVIPYTWQALKGERLLRLVVEGLSIPYLERYRELRAPDLTGCACIEIEFAPSALEFLFPHANQQSLFNSAEREYLRSLDKLVVSDSESLKAIADDVSLGLDDAFVTGLGTAHLTCRDDDHRIRMSLRVTSDASILAQDGQVFRYPARYYAKSPAMSHVKYPGNLPSMRSLTSQIQAMEVRVQCAANLKHLWHRLRSYWRVSSDPADHPSRDGNTIYPPPPEWGDAVLKAYEGHDITERMGTLWTCPSAEQGKCHYAMNPNCKYDSPPDTVLLFETKAGWNQHGGPKLFTFDNHDPKGGCVLLNDGTVKFIRTKEELHQLRWK